MHKCVKANFKMLETYTKLKWAPQCLTQLVSILVLKSFPED